jgi:hypothetical protein
MPETSKSKHSKLLLQALAGGRSFDYLSTKPNYTCLVGLRQGEFKGGFGGRGLTPMLGASPMLEGSPDLSAKPNLTPHPSPNPTDLERGARLERRDFTAMLEGSPGPAPLIPKELG